MYTYGIKRALIKNFVQRKLTFSFKIGELLADALSSLWKHLNTFFQILKPFYFENSIIFISLSLALISLK